MEYTVKQESFLRAAAAKHGGGAVLTKQNLAEVAEGIGMKFPFWMTDTRRAGSFTKIGKDMYRLPAIDGGEGASVADIVVEEAAEVARERAGGSNASDYLA